MSDVMGVLLVAIAMALPASAAEPVQIEQGTITYTVEHRFKTFSGAIRAEDAELLLGWDGVDPTGLDFKATIPLGGFDSGNRLRDEHAAEVLQLYLFAEATWVVDRVEVVSGDPRAGAGTNLVLRASGPLSLKGISKPLEVDLQVQLGESTQVHGEFTISLEDFGIERPGLLGFKIADQVRIEVDLLVLVAPPGQAE